MMMSFSALRCVVLFWGIVFLPSTLALAQSADRKASPFEGVRWMGGSPEVLVESVWYQPVAIHGVAVEDILEFCGDRWPGQVPKRFGEDLVEALQLMGHTVPASVDLTLVRIADNERVELPGVVMSAANRRAILRANSEARRGDRGENGRPARPPSHLDRAAALDDIEAFERGLDDQFAYRHWRSVDLGAELDAVRGSLGDEVSTGELAAALNRVLMTFGDGHARVTSPWSARPERYPPFLLGEAGGGVVAFRPDRGGFLDPDRPYLLAIDGKPLGAWIDAARPGIANGSPQLIRDRALRGMRDLELLRGTLGLPARDTVRCLVAGDPDGTDSTEIEAGMTPERPLYGSWPRRDSGVIEGKIGYLRIARMSGNSVPEIRAAMESFRGTDGLIVDVRGNGGGTREPLIVLAGYLTAPDDAPWIGNAAKYRLSDRFDRDHLGARYMYRADHPRWTPDQRAAIAAFADGFEPEWEPGAGFSAWHYLVLGRTGHEAEYWYDQPVVVLSDAGCFSATDILLGALAGRPGVTVMGRASAGGSARSRGFRLPNSGIEVRCASMASFRPDGRMYDGRGIEVDVPADPEPGDFLNGGSDTVFEAAVASILER